MLANDLAPVLPQISEEGMIPNKQVSCCIYAYVKLMGNYVITLRLEKSFFLRQIDNSSMGKIGKAINKFINLAK